MKSSEQIVESILSRVAELYADPLEHARTVGELDSLLFQSHWLWADATDRMDDFVSARWNVFESDTPGWKEIHLSSDFQNVVTDPLCFQTIIREWQRLGSVLGIQPDQRPMQSARLTYLPFSAAGFRALMSGEAEFERCLGVLPADGLRAFVVSDEVSPDFLAKLGTSEAPDPWNYGFVLVPDVSHSGGRREAIGLASFKGPPDGEGLVEIAYCIVPGYQNRGFATEAAAALVEFALADPRVRLIRAHTMPTNDASTKVLECNGFKLQGPVIDPEDGEVWRWDLPKSSS